MKKVVIALGGNAILKKGEESSIARQFENTKNALKPLINVIRNNSIVVSHGNGPQVGQLLLQDSNMPLDVLDAETEGQLGYLIQQSIYNLFRENRIKRNVVSILTQVLVDKKDAELLKKKGFIIKEDIGRGYRRVVASPKPLVIIEADIIRDLLSSNIIVIAAGGGGIPVNYQNNKLKGVEAVIDKDLASACLANGIKADPFIMITDVDKVYLNFKKKNQKSLNKVKLNEIKRYYKEGHFPPGSMGPKIEAAINFLGNNGKKVIITNIKNIEKAINGKAGTIIER